MNNQEGKGSFQKGEDPRRHTLTRSERTGRPPKAWKDWLREMEPSVRKKWEELFEKASPALRVRMMEDFFDRLHGKATQTTEFVGDETRLRIVLQYVDTPTLIKGSD